MNKREIGKAVPSIREMWARWYPIGTTGLIQQGVQRQLGRVFLERVPATGGFDCSIYEYSSSVPAHLYRGEFDGCEIGDIVAHWMRNHSDGFDRRAMVDAVRARLGGDDARYD